MTQTAGVKGFGGRLAQERRLKSVREHHDLDKQDVAKALQVSASTYGRWEDGSTVPNDAAMERLAEYFGVTPAWLRYGQEPREAAPKRAKVEAVPEVRVTRDAAGAKRRRA